ncbi:MAG: hypothetical protein JW891_13570 [Candidatus Lokiarchaeota archaeon]|nr:hypothetical protein [Candidatus Lokiarchaeota archaeon]
MRNILFVHGLESSGKGFKGTYLKKIFPEILTPDFPGGLQTRLEKLNKILEPRNDWIVIGSSFGGLMGTLYALKNPEKISLLILLAPLLIHPQLNAISGSIDVPVIIFHGRNDDVVPLTPTKERAMVIFKNLTYNEVEDDHFLRPTTEKIPWKKIVKSPLKNPKA